MTKISKAAELKQKALEAAKQAYHQAKKEGKLKPISA